MTKASSSTWTRSSKNLEEIRFVNFDKIPDNSHVILFYKNKRRGASSRAFYSNGQFYIIDRDARRLDGAVTLENIKLRCTGYVFITGLSPYLCRTCDGLAAKCDECKGVGILVEYFIEGMSDERRIYSPIP